MAVIVGYILQMPAATIEFVPHRRAYLTAANHSLAGTQNQPIDVGTLQPGFSVGTIVGLVYGHHLWLGVVPDLSGVSGPHLLE
jgi:hypothetical protein